MKTGWIKIIFIFILILLVCIYGCKKSTIYEDEVTSELKLSQKIYSNDDTLKGTFTVRNLTQATKIFHFVNSCQFGFLILLNEETQYNEPSGCRESPSEFKLLAGESKEFEISYSLIDNDGNDLPLGNYEIEAYLFNTEYKVTQPFQLK